MGLFSEDCALEVCVALATLTVKAQRLISALPTLRRVPVAECRRCRIQWNVAGSTRCPGTASVFREMESDSTLAPGCGLPNIRLADPVYRISRCSRESAARAANWLIIAIVWFFTYYYTMFIATVRVAVMSHFHDILPSRFSAFIMTSGLPEATPKYL